MPKFSAQDADYKARRTIFSERYGKRELWSAVDQWALYCGTGNLARFLAIEQIFRSTLGVPGHVAEFGSYRGANLLFLAKLLRILDPHGSKVTHCFDTFEGLKKFSAQDGNVQVLGGNAPYTQGSLLELRDVIGLYGMEDEIQIHEGDVNTTLPALLKKDAALTFSFVYNDVDLYEPTKTVLENVHGRLSVGGVIVLDEWNYEDCQGETVATREFLEQYGHLYCQEHVQGARQPSLVLRKLATR